jgi:hypothetical protein
MEGPIEFLEGIATGTRNLFGSVVGGAAGALSMQEFKEKKFNHKQHRNLLQVEKMRLKLDSFFTDMYI